MTPLETMELSAYLRHYLTPTLGPVTGASCDLPKGQPISVTREWVESLVNQTVEKTRAYDMEWARKIALEVVRQYGAQRLTDASAPAQNAAPAPIQIQLVVPAEAIKVQAEIPTKVVTFDRDARGNIVKARSSVEEESEARSFLGLLAAP